MHLSALITIAVAATTASACTFGMTAMSHYNTGDASGGAGCKIFIHDKDLTKDNIDSGKFSFEADGTCSNKCDTVKYKGKTWEFCHSMLSPLKPDNPGNTISVRQVDNDGDKLNFHSGDNKHYSYVNPFSSMTMNHFLRSGISC
ncbi:hypothetical protein N7517_009903 [Penicillium concentricum]|uniref:Uncharacterized protein n=1 Tax=Penicillium concentricum TaxID=293559 RepID=A0A9W9RI45_9EURO|nr:uncharacterized protein N7517_009903 [Penicillium concentricum]KAJ5360712.1 hypothetical protein N7517_009903 [Penicillium concentricum]